MSGEGYAYRAVDGDKWYKNSDRDAEKVLSSPYDRCKTAMAVRP